ncbi:MAG: ribosome recycling factor [Patescibacteria group bacterium]
MEREEFEKIIIFLEKELSNLRTGRAMPNLVENIKVEAYGAFTPLNQLASINAPEPQTLTISPWDQSVIKAIEKAIYEANLDLNPVVEGKIIRINFPPLTEEKRKELVKIMYHKVEEAKIKIKTSREEIIRGYKQQEKDKDISEDERFRMEKELQTTVDEYHDKIKQIAEKKECDLLKV